MARAFRRTSKGVEARLDDDEADLLRGLVVHVDQLLDQDPACGDEVLARLFPDGYREDAEAAAELRSLMQDDLVAGKRAALATITATLAERGAKGRLQLDDDQAEQWLTALNDLRLTLGTRLGVTEEMYDDIGAGTRHDVEEQMLDVYGWLGWLQEHLVESLLPTVDEPGER